MKLNPLFNLLGTNANPMIKQFMQFKQSFKGDAREQVQQLLDSGQISQEQYNKAVEMANQLQSMMK